MSSTKVPDNMTSWSFMDSLKSKTRMELLRIVASPIRDNSINSTERKMKDYFKKCVDEREIENVGLRPLLEVFNKTSLWSMLRKF